MWNPSKGKYHTLKNPQSRLFMTPTKSKDSPKPKGPCPRVASRLNDKVKPNNNIPLKRPLSAYNLFYQEERQNVRQTRNEQVQKLLRQQHGNTTDIMIQQQQLTKVGGVVGLTNHVASKWNALDDTTKRRYHFMAALEKARYRKVKRDMKKQNKIMTMMQDVEEADDADDADDDNKEKERIKKDDIQPHGMIQYPEIAKDCGVIQLRDHEMALLPPPTLFTKQPSPSPPPSCPEVELDFLTNRIFHELDESIMEQAFLLDMSGSNTKSLYSSPTLTDSSEPRNSKFSTTTTEDSQDTSLHLPNWWSVQQLHFDLEDEERDFIISTFLPS